MTIAYTYFVIPRYIETFQVNEKVILLNSPTLFSTFDYPGDANNKRLRVAHESAQQTVRRRTYIVFRSCVPILRQSTH
jgi:hypothetical protein